MDDELELTFLTDTERVAGLIASELPELNGLAVTRFGEGWDHVVFAAGDDWLVRFPKRARRVPWLLREVAIMEVVGETLTSGVPRLERVLGPSADFPYPFVAYRRIPGVGSDVSDLSNAGGLARDVGHMLDGLHRVDPGRIPVAPASWESVTLEDERHRLLADTGRVLELIDADVANRATAYLTGRVPVPARDAPLRFVHNDICPDHLIIDPVSGRLNGLIDFADAIVGDPVVDFVGLVGLGGRRFVEQALSHYRLPLGQGFAETWEWLARTLSLRWLAEAAADNPAQIPKHVRWVRNAFNTPG